MNEKYLIGEFSELTDISKRMLRHYDKINLFSPVEVSEVNGYRYYSNEQIIDLKKIQLLRQLGFTLSKVSEIMTDSFELDSFVDLLKDNEVKLTKQSDDIKSSLLMTTRLINMLEKENTGLFPSLLKLTEEKRSIVMVEKKIVLSELMNRDMFMESIEEVLLNDNNDTYHFITVDIDKFMHVNDFYGFEVGDLVIQTIFSIIYNNFLPLMNESEKDNFITRLGGDECSVFLKNFTDEVVIKVTETVLSEIRSFDYESIGCKTPVTSSCGIASGSKPVHIAKFKDQSAKALLDAKRNGSDQYIIKNY